MDRFDDLFESVDEAGERERLRRVHELLLTVDPPPAVVPRLRHRERRRSLPLLAAAVPIGAFGGGYLLGDRDEQSETVRTIEMRGVGPERGASATIELLEADPAGNWPMVVSVRGLAPNRPGYDFYELWLTKDGKLLGSCGRFKIRGDRADVSLSVPYPLGDYDGWVVTRGRSDEPLLTT